LISEEGAEPSTPDKRVADIDGNQERLLRALARYQASLNTIILDGHFCLRNERGESEPVPAAVFRRLSATAFLLLSEDPEQIAARLSARDSRQHQLESIVGLMACEQSTAKRLSKRLRVPLKLLRGTSAVDDAANFISSLPI
jgi:adenylate kinase